MKRHILYYNKLVKRYNKYRRISAAMFTTQLVLKQNVINEMYNGKSLQIISFTLRSYRFGASIFLLIIIIFTILRNISGHESFM